ncbi:ubiquitin-associated protein 1 [Eucyclogobius newberryi]|uniref:ubiquitin-associated protein 1-like n=1 Tax=Eucyclogobius newberryi TaxID=166745 RepID=UPI003B5B243B
MAARKSGSGSDAHNNGPVSYLEDVPFKVNERFRCPSKVGFPVGFCVPDSALLLAQYDFSLERRSVQWGLELAEARLAQTRADEAVIGRGDADGRGEEPDAGSADAHEPPPPALNPVLAAMSHNAILTPLPAPSLGPRSSLPAPALHSLDLTDFEREEDPFDKLELKTLDDKEELRSILQSQPQPFSSPSEGPRLGPGSRGSSPSPPSAASTASSTATVSAGGGAASKAFTHKPNGLVDDRPCNIRSLSFPKLSDSEHHVAPSSLKQAPPPSTRLPNGSPQRTQRGEVIVAPEPALNKSGNAKAVNSVSCGGGGGGLPCGGALLSMTPAERQCVETLVGMGYSYEGVLRAMQRQGQNVEQVLDYLFVHSRLCDRGFDSSAVEECLEMYQCSEEKALQFLQLMSRFGEMGFERDAIKEVLLFHNNDQDKALEELMSRAAAS